MTQDQLAYIFLVNDLAFCEDEEASLSIRKLLETLWEKPKISLEKQVEMVRNI